MEDKALLNELLYKLSGFSTTAKKSKDKVKIDLNEICKNGYSVAFKSFLKSSLSSIHRCTEATELALECQWVQTRLCTRLDSQSTTIMAKVDKSLKNRTFLASNEISLVDVIWALSLAPHMENLTFAEKEMLVNVTRWYSQVCDQLNLSCTGNFIKSKTSLYS
ncbi:hypothetical protein EB796_009611 [Bugula neritina]|uniref:Glutathione S-transferase C-terminal domain-containing protein n=1 Tax=Bugula neritina TaxID=10212 RepID=A0A7J7K2C7_BUGNE|nr:hypothetical protein EB796_009611 [Bugula neritina]